MKNIVKLINNTNVYDIVKKTPLTYAQLLSLSYANNIYLKREDKTAVHSFKIRGAYQKIYSLTQAQRQQGIITATAGNHAQGVALSAQKLAIKNTIVMPKTTPKIKISAVNRLGAKTILFGNTYDEALQFAQELAKEQNLIFIHAYDDEQVIAGQGTIAVELLEQLDNIDYIFVPVGGGGLIAGITSYIKTIKPDIKIIGVEPTESPTLTESLAQKSQVILDNVGLFADGVAVRKVGGKGFRLVSKLIDGTILVSNDEICAAIKDIYDDARTIAEPSGALAIAGAKKYINKNKLKNNNIIAILSGSNVNFDRLRHIAERAELGENKEVILAVDIAEEAGSFLSFCKTLDGRTITEFNYRYAQADIAHIFVGIATDNIAQKNNILNLLTQNYSVIDMSDNEMAKTHIRYMVGGKGILDGEVLYMFVFPEKPGALLNFLISIGSRWNISLFHYRNHGADFGRVLVGFQVVDDVLELEQKLDKLGYKYCNETNNIAYKYFL